VLPSLLSWTNAGQYYDKNVARGSLLITWTGGAIDQIVRISGTSSISDPLVPANTTGAGFSCEVSASAGTFTVPARIVETLPAARSGVVTYMGTLEVKTYGVATFSPPLMQGGTVDTGIFSWAVADIRPVIWQ
jgi:hypothetical protein